MMVSEVISARLGTSHPEDNPALAGCCPPPAASERPLQDVKGRPLLPRIARALRAGVTLPAPTVVVDRSRSRALEMGAVTNPFDPAWVPMALQRGWIIRGEQLGRALRRVATTLQVWAQRAHARRDLRSVVGLYSSLGGPVPWADLGGTRNELISEARKPFWRA